MNEFVTDRRDFLKSSAILTSGLILSMRLPLSDFALAANTEFRPNAWLQFTLTGEIVFILDKAEMGQGVFTTLASIVAEELGVEPHLLKIRKAPADRVYINPMNGIQITGGSSSVAESFDPLRRAAATARYLLEAAAAKKWGVSIESCEMKEDRVFHRGSDRSLGFSALVAIATTLVPPAEVQLKKIQHYALLGKPIIPRLDNHQKITGMAQFGIDVSLPKMLTAIIVRAPAVGSTIDSFDATEVLKMPGVKGAFRVSTGVAIVAEKYWQLIPAREQLQVQWRKDPEGSTLSSQKITDRFRKNLSKKGKSLRKEGDVESALKRCSVYIDAEYELPYLAHATMEPCNFTADVRLDSCYLYGPTQSAGIAQQVAVEMTGLPFDKVFVETTFLGGGFGRRLEQDYVKEAVEVSRLMKCPVKVMWSREDDMKNSMYRPANLHRLRGGLDSSGELVAWSHQMVGPSILSQVASDYAKTSFPQWLPNWTKAVGGWAGKKSFAIQSNDPTAMEGAKNLAYSVPNLWVDYIQDDPGVPLGFWRSVGHSYTAFVVESFVDELARKANADPFEFRCRFLTMKETERNLGVLKLVAEKASWGSKKKDVGRGIAQHASFGSYVAYAVDVTLVDDEIRLSRVVAAVDCGFVVNPDGARAQIESAVNFALSSILKGEITLSEGEVEQSNFDTYELLRFNEAPREVEIHFVSNSHPPSGLGEPGVPPLAPAISNALFDLTGKRLRRLPLRLG